MHPDWLIPDWHARGVGAVMTTRRGGFSQPPFDSMNIRVGIGDDPQAVHDNQRLLAEAMGVTPVYLNQVHGTTVVRLTAADLKSGAPIHAADASVTTKHGIACAAQVADCLPVLFAAPGAVGAAHAGWRGLAGGVLEATVKAVCEAAGCQAGQVQTWLGACIGPRHFEVGTDVLEAFQVDPVKGSPWFRVHADGKWMADLPGLARDRLARLGVASISGGHWCTADDPARFFSYRRDRTTGRMVAVVWLQ
ncbi:MAG: peptidoglycan editing factor PgeF [Burkholderiales bacterium]|jgi:polyphenol oxidase|nr:peptidoglycan editing factor PgeF [Burkholderiales bacterium]